MPRDIEVHASAVAIDGRGVMCVGPSGSGKSSLCLQLMAFGARLVADDRCVLRKADGGVEIRRPPDLPQMIEARGVGLIQAVCVDPVRLSLVVDLTKTTATRLPEPETRDFLGQDVAVLHKVDSSHFAAAIFAYARQIEI